METAITFWVASKFSVRFIELMFFTGMAFTAISFYFSSSGGVISDFSSSQASAQTGFIQKRESFVFRRGPLFTSSLIFFMIGLVLFILLISGIIPPVNWSIFKEFGSFQALYWYLTCAICYWPKRTNKKDILIPTSPFVADFSWKIWNIFSLTGYFKAI